MTCHYDIADDGSSMDVYDHTGSLVRTVDNDSNGFSIDDVRDVIMDEYIAEVTPGSAPVHSQRAIELLDHALRRDIEPGTP